jgi:transposase InsO family protein
MKVSSIGSKCVYMATFVDDCTRVSWVYYIQKKSQLHQKFDDFRAYVKTQWDAEIQIFRSDRGGEYQSTDFISKLQSLGIVHQLTISHSPQQNGLAERMNRTLVGSAKSMLHAAGLSQGFWLEAVATANHVRN